MKALLYIYFSMLFLACSPTELWSQKTALNIDKNINENKGTYVIRSINKDLSLSKDSATVTIRIFQNFCNPLKGSTNPIHMLAIDYSHYALNREGTITINVAKGFHNISIDYPYEPPYSPFKTRLLKFKRRTHYHIDIYLSTPFPIIYH